jgi:hypothetical protein
LERTADTMEQVRTQQEVQKKAVQEARVSKRRGER